MTKWFVSIIIFGALGYWSYSAWQSSVEERQQQAEAEHRAEKLKAKVVEVASKHSAATDWPSRLAHDERFRTSPVLAAELQDLWLNGRPILFIGSISDVVRTSGESVALTLAYGSLDQAHMFFGTRLRIKVQCPSGMTNPLVYIARQPGRMNLQSEAAVVAEIATIDASIERDEEGKSVAVLTGAGRCIAVVPIPEPTFWWPKNEK